MDTPKRGFLIKNMSKYINIKNISLTSLILTTAVFNIVIAAAPIEPIIQTPEYIVESSSLAAQSLIEQGYRKIVKAPITGYSSTPDQTDDTPLITASNTFVRDGVIASNFLPFGTKVRIPELFGDKVFVVEDRMHERFSDRIDIWFPDRESAKQFGLRKATVQIF